MIKAPSVILSALLRGAPLMALATAGCAAMQAQYNSALDNAVTVSNADQTAYTQVAVDSFSCSDNGAPCSYELGEAAADQLAMSLSRIGYQVFDTQQFHTWLVQPPVHTVVAHPGAAGASVHIGPDGVSMSASDGYDEVSVSASASGGGAMVSSHVGPAGGEIVMYESLPMDTRQVIIEQSGIRGVVTGRIRVTHDDFHDWDEIHTLIRLGDAATGAMIWQGEWRETIGADESLDSGVDTSLQYLEKALQRKQPLQAPPASVNTPVAARQSNQPAG